MIHCPPSPKTLPTTFICVLTAGLLSAGAAAEDADSGPFGKLRMNLWIRRYTDSKWAEEKFSIPREAVSVFTYEGQPHVHITEKYIAADYGVSGVLFDVGTGKMVRRYTMLDGWPDRHPRAFDPKPHPTPLVRRLVDPGLVARRRPWRRIEDGEKPPLSVAAEVRLGKRTFRAMQPALSDIPRSKGSNIARKEFGRWKNYLDVSSRLSCVQAVAGDKTRRYTTGDGLAGNIVSHLVVSGRTLWAACVDVYDEDRKVWGPGGLCRYDARADRWIHVKTVNDKPVGWVTLLEAHGDELWVGFREGQGITGEKIMYGMGLYPGLYRPKVTAIVLARLKDGKWTVWSRKPCPETRRQRGGTRATAEPPTEIPRKLAVFDDRVLLYSTTRSNVRSGNFYLPRDGQISELNLRAGKWRLFDPRKDLGTHRLMGLNVQGRHVILRSETNVHQWDEKRASWRRLETHCTLPNPAIGDVSPIGDELWVGYTAQGHYFTGIQGISRYDGKAGRWSFMTSEELGTSCNVQSIAPGPGNQAWVLFAQKEWYTAAIFIPRQEPPTSVASKAGVGRFADGKWQFPVKLPGVPESVQRSRRGPVRVETWQQSLPIRQLAGAGGAVFVVNGLGVYAGPGQWRRIYDKQVIGIEALADARTLGILRYKGADAEGPKYDLGLYEPKTGKLTFRKVKRSDPDSRYPLFGGRLSRGGDHSRGAARLLTKKPGDWYVCSYWHARWHGTGGVRLIESPRAFWIASTGRLVRIDRKKLPHWVGR